AADRALSKPPARTAPALSAWCAERAGFHRVPPTRSPEARGAARASPPAGRLLAAAPSNGELRPISASAVRWPQLQRGAPALSCQKVGKYECETWVRRRRTQDRHRGPTRLHNFT